MKVRGHLSIPVYWDQGKQAYVPNGTPRFTKGYPSTAEAPAAVIALSVTIPDSTFDAIPVEIEVDEDQVKVEVGVKVEPIEEDE